MSAESVVCGLCGRKGAHEPTCRILNACQRFHADEECRPGDNHPGAAS